MKKVSTAAVKRSRNISQQKPTIGLDLGDRNSWYCVLDEAGEIQLEQRVRTTTKAFQEVIGESRRKDDRLDAQTLARLARIDPELLSPMKHHQVGLRLRAAMDAFALHQSPAPGVKGTKSLWRMLVKCG
jgi:transposase